ncbi:MAG: BlaI/MecI/CopY family transcriptional regulator [Bacteroidales bacterium]|nr:BlaI/MecI/CopY family transcriptional regulator [Bacteroidota bacterium]MCF8348276.1 BlaI/MecI/CopY family transcriptional regulator [Bacteroidales bacterium]
MKQLTKAEEQVMQVLWQLKKAYVRDIIDQLPAPKPAYNTVSTIVRILERKGFVGYSAFGKSHEYFPRIEKKTYRSRYFKEVLKNYFGDSYRSLASFFTKEQNLSIEELEEIKGLIEREIERKTK